MSEQKYRHHDLMGFWKMLPMIPRDHYFKNIPLDILDEMGWRWDEEKNSYFIPYFSASKTSIPFAQWRHLSGDRRFTMLKEAKPTCYGTWNLDNPVLFIVEGTSDCAVLHTCGVPWIGLPSASSTELLKAMAGYCRDEGIKLVYAGDNDAAGDKLRQALDEVAPYRVKQPRAPYKDWGDMYEAEGLESVQEYCFQELFPPDPKRFGEPVDLDTSQQTLTLSKDKTDVEKVLELFPGSTEVELKTPPPPTKSKEQSATGATPLY